MDVAMLLKLGFVVNNYDILLLAFISFSYYTAFYRSAIFYFYPYFYCTLCNLDPS